MAADAPALAHHLDRYAWDFFTDFGHEHILNKAISFMFRSPKWTSDVGQDAIPYDICVDFQIGIRNIVATCQRVITRSMTANLSARSFSYQVDNEDPNKECLDDASRFIAMPELEDLDYISIDTMICNMTSS